jgi:hypothetical protein
MEALGSREGVFAGLKSISSSSIGLTGGCSICAGDASGTLTVGTTKVKSSFAFDGLLEGGITWGTTILEGVLRGDANFGVPSLVGVGSRGSPGDARTHGRTFLAVVRFGDELIDFGVTALGLGLLGGGLVCSLEAWSWLLTE